MRYRLSHDLTSYHLPGAFAFREDVADAGQEEIVSRLIDYYSYMKAEVERLNVASIQGIWARFGKLFAEFEATLNAKDVKAVSEALLKVCTTPLVSGFASYHHFDSIFRDPRARMFESYLTVDRFLGLAEALGAEAPQVPDQGRRGYHDLDLGRLLNGIRSRLPFDMRPPKAGGGAFGLRTSEGILSSSDILAMYVADRVHHVLSEHPDRVVCEIGGGTGTLACYLAKTSATQVMVADLPIVSIIQGYYLMKSVGPENVQLASEPAGDHKVRILPYWELDTLPAKSVSMFVNVDSMPEIDADIAKHYIGLIKTVGVHAFLSINQESAANGQNIVHNLISNAGGFRRAYRCPYWLLNGYVEELYAIAPAGTGSSGSPAA